MWDAELLEIKRRSSTSNELIEAVTGELHQFPFTQATDRIWAALPLLKSSIDIGAASTQLLLQDPIQYGIASAALHRPQLEQFLRGAFFGCAALTTGDEVARFLKNEDMPKRPNKQGEEKSVTLNFMARAVAKEISKKSTGTEPPAWEKLPNMVEYAKKFLDSAVHGGSAVHASYYNDMVCFDPRPLADGALIANTAVIALLAMTQISQLYSDHGGTTQISFSSSFDKRLREFFNSAPNFPKALSDTSADRS
jgi:hypothetical protein